jgi:hypothetical protein
MPLPAEVDYSAMIDGYADTKTLNTLKKKVGQFATRTGKHYFIGKACGTHKPEKRWTEKYEPRGYDKMIVLCRTPSPKEALWLEAEMITYFKDKKEGRHIDNPIGGGGGRTGDGQGYVYLVLGGSDDDIDALAGQLKAKARVA